MPLFFEKAYRFLYWLVSGSESSFSIFSGMYRSFTRTKRCRSCFKKSCGEQ